MLLKMFNNRGQNVDT